MEREREVINILIIVLVALGIGALDVIGIWAYFYLIGHALESAAEERRKKARKGP